MKSRSSKKVATVDTKWFNERLAAQKMSRRNLAALIGLDPSAVSLMLRGRRGVKPGEVIQIAKILGNSSFEVLERFGYASDHEVRKREVEFFADRSGIIRKATINTPLLVNSPRDVPADGIVVQMRSTNSSVDGWIFFASQMNSQLDTLVGNLCVAEVDDGRRVLGILHRGYEPERWNIVPLTEASTISDLSVTSAAKVLWVKPSVR